MVLTHPYVERSRRGNEARRDMTLEGALEEFSLLQRRRHRGEDGRRFAAALDALREYLLNYSGFTEPGDISPRDLLHFLLDYYPSQDEPDAEVALALLEACAGFALWLTERGERRLAPFLRDEDPLRRDLPRVLEALSLLKEHADRDRLTPPVLAEDGEEPPAAVSSGMDRVAHLDRLDYGAAEEEYFRVTAVGEAAVALQSVEREALGEGAVEAVPVPAPAAGLLRAGDIIHAEIAPGTGGWELLEVFGIRPGGYA
jgi:hypothetical protein